VHSNNRVLKANLALDFINSELVEDVVTNAPQHGHTSQSPPKDAFVL
jgi:hypothetical protein